jgi:ABC-type Na+ efflux pump permease subunit
VNRLTIAFAIYAILGVLAWSTISDSRIRLVTVAILALFAVRTLVNRRNVMHGEDK